MEALENNEFQYPDSELVLSGKDTVYHLAIRPQDIATTILLVGDQDRVALISRNFDTIRHQSQHREFVVHTGTYKGKEISVISTGIGTDNIDIVVNELDALFNIDLEKRKDKSSHTSLTLIRIGTSGILQEHIPVDSFILSQHALGLDNVARFYKIPFSDYELQKEVEINRFLAFPPTLSPYFVSASAKLFQRFNTPSVHAGITATSSGFYGPQGRQLRIPVQTANLNEKLASFVSSDGLKFTNFEMETSALYALGKALGHECLTICLGIANRAKKEFSSDYQTHIERLIRHVLNTLSS